MGTKIAPRSIEGHFVYLKLRFDRFRFGLGFVRSRIGDAIVRLGGGRSGLEDFLEIVHIFTEDSNDFDSLFSSHGMCLSGSEDGGS